MRVEAVVDRLADLVASRPRGRIIRVAVDGPDAAGKTTLADSLASTLEARGRPVVRVGIDGFQRPRAERYRRGPLSPLGYFMDAFDYAALRAAVLDPLGPGGDGRYRAAVFDYRSDTPLAEPARQAPLGAVLVVDGVFLLRDELRDAWDLSVHLDVTPDESLRRALDRDLPLFGSADVIEERYRRRYLPAQELYRRTARPLEAATVVIDNEDPDHPVLVRAGME